MKRTRRRLPVPQFEFGFTTASFRLIQETGIDGERLARANATSQHAPARLRQMRRHRCFQAEKMDTKMDTKRVNTNSGK